MKVISFNVRCCDDVDGHSIEERVPRLQSVLDKHNADLLGLQEVRTKWANFLQSTYSDAYEILLVRREKTEKDTDAGVIMWKKNAFACLDTGHFWLSDTPDVQSKGWDEKYNCYRICVWAKLREIETNKEFVFLNTHYGFGEKGQVSSGKLIAERVGKLTDTAIIVGDFNMRRETKGYAQMCQSFTDVNAATTKDFSTTYHGYGKYENSHIDYCFITPKTVTPRNSIILKDTFDGKYPSDHYGLLFDVEIN